MRYRIPGRPWFKTLRPGFPVEPVTWEGRAFTGAYLAGLILFAQAAGLLPPFATAPPLLPFFAGVALLTSFFTVFCWLKSEERDTPVKPVGAKVGLLDRRDAQGSPARWI